MDRNYRPAANDPNDTRQRSDALAVSGPNRPKYFRRPMLAAAEIHIKQAPPSQLPPLPSHQDLNATAPAAMGGAGGLGEPRSKTIGTQSDYRENEAQTAPWEPGYVLPAPGALTAKQAALMRRYHTDVPEVLQLKDLAFPDGLPAGLQVRVCVCAPAMDRGVEAQRAGEHAPAMDRRVLAQRGGDWQKASAGWGDGRGTLWGTCGAVGGVSSTGTESPAGNCGGGWTGCP